MKFKMPPKPKLKISRRSVTVLIFALTLSVLLGLLIFSAFFIQKVSSFEIVGETRYTDEYLIELSGIEPGEPLYFRSFAAAEQRILENAPRLKSVKIRAGLFSSVRIEVVEEKGSYFCEINGDYYLLSSDLRALEMSKDPDIYKSEAVRFSLYPEDITSAVLGEYIEFKNEKTKREVLSFANEINSISFGDYGVTSFGFEGNMWREAYVVLDGRLKIIFDDVETAQKKIGFALHFIYESKITYEFSQIIIVEGKNGYEAYYSEVDFVE